MNDERSIKLHRKDVPIPDDLIPINQVMNDMMDPNGGMGADGARSYYYLHYASDAERARMEKEDRNHKIFAIAILACMLGLAVYTVVINIMK